MKLTSEQLDALRRAIEALERQAHKRMQTLDHIVSADGKRDAAAVIILERMERAAQ